MGGTGVELYRDVAVDFPPLNQALARTIISDTKVSQLLRGYRGGTPVDMDALEQALVKASYLLVDFPEILEMDVNPLQVRPDGLHALDARIMIEPKDVRKITQPGSHLIISMYPTKYEWDVNLNGEKVGLRAIRPEDENLWREMIESFSAETTEYRFFGPVKEITKSMLVRYCHIDYDREIAIVAIGGKARKKQMLGRRAPDDRNGQRRRRRVRHRRARQLPAPRPGQPHDERSDRGRSRPVRARDLRSRAGGQRRHGALRRVAGLRLAPVRRPRDPQDRAAGVAPPRLPPSSSSWSRPRSWPASAC